MALTETQRTELAADICASTDPDVVAALAVRNDTELTRLYNLDSAFTVWRESVAPEEYRDVMDWTEVDVLNAGDARIWEWITQNMSVPYDATKLNVRQGLADAWGSNTVTRANLIAISKELASVAEEIYATGTGTDSDPGVRDFIGNITTEDVGRALNDNPCV